MLNFPIFIAKFVCCSVLLGALTEKKEQSGASKNIVKKKANKTPKQTLFPTVLRGSTGVKFKERKPIAVVIDVKNNG